MHQEYFNAQGNVILSPVKWQFTLINFSDIVVFSRSPREQWNPVKQIMSLSQGAEATLKLNKCSFFTGTFDYLKHTTGPLLLKVATHTTDAMKRLKTSTKVIKLRSFPRLFDVFPRFVPRFARIGAPLRKKLKSDQPTHFGVLSADEPKAMHELQDKLVSSPILALIYAWSRWNIDTDTCNVQLGCVLIQEQPDGASKPVRYWFWSSIKSE